MLLRDIVNGKEPSSCIILQDSLEASARRLLLSFMKSLLDRVDLVCLVCFELPPCKILNGFKADAKSKLLPVDGFSNYLKWDDIANQCSDDIPQLFFDSNITDVVKKAVNRRCSLIKSGSPAKVAIVIDSISKLILNKSVSQTCQVLHHLSQIERDNIDAGYNVDQVISIVHSDLHDSQSLETLCSVASSVLHILPSMRTSSQSESEHEDKSDEMENYCKTLHIRKTGKVLKKKQKYTISHQLELTEFAEEDWIPKANVQQEPEKQTSKTVDPLSDLTFNLKLTKQEEQDRANMHLPYMHHAPPAQVKIHQNQVKESQIFYQPDEADDFDEDDPDDDLDI